MLAGLHHRDRNGEGRRICTSDLMHVTHPLWLTELCPQEMVGAKRAARFTSRVSNERSAVELRPRNGVPSRNLTSNLMLRTHPLCDLSYEDKIGARVR